MWSVVDAAVATVADLFFLLHLFDVLFLVSVVFCSSYLSAVSLRPIDFQLKKAHFSLIADFAKVVAFFLRFRSRCLLFYAAFFYSLLLISLFCCRFFSSVRQV